MQASTFRDLEFAIFGRKSSDGHTSQNAKRLCSMLGHVYNWSDTLVII